MKLTGRSFLVTGGGSGLGAATARELVANGGRVVIADVNADAARSQAESLGKHAAWEQVDVTNSEDVLRAIQRCVQFGEAIHGVVQCAGILAAARIAGRDGPHDLELFRRVVEVNLIGTFNGLRLAAAAMQGNEPDENGERGVIINTASISAFEGQIGQAAYSAAKGGVAGLTLPAARELASLGIRVVAIAPGVFQTPMMAAAPEKIVQSLQQQAVFPARLGDPAEFAALVRHVVENPMLNGCVLRIDGAMRMQAR